MLENTILRDDIVGDVDYVSFEEKEISLTERTCIADMGRKQEE
ncbi:hypothetical protein [Oceanobacillus damuensis]|nr:hypothetical protein [Oceanobacillus damuensis]